MVRGGGMGVLPRGEWGRRSEFKGSVSQDEKKKL